MKDEPATNTTSIVFTGDLAFTKYFSQLTNKGAGIFDNEVSTFLRTADYCVGNIEGPVLFAEQADGAEFLHYSDASCVAALADENIRIWNLANNHSLDFGETGISHTQECAASLGCRTLGAGKTAAEAAEPLLLKSGGGVGLLSFSYSPGRIPDSECACLNWNDTEAIKCSIARIKEDCRWCVLVVHGGDEFASMPMPRTRERYLRYLEYGADVIVAHHPHVPQNYERVGDKIIFYSLGNFVFDTDYQRSQPHTDVGLLVRLSFSESGFSWEHLPIHINRELHKVENGATPAIFTEIGDREYRRLWPLAAAALAEADHRKRRYLEPEEYEGFSRLQWFLRDVKMFLRGKTRKRLYGQVLSFFGLWRTADRSLVEYLLHDIQV